MFRQVKLPASCPGQLFLHSVPGRNEPLSAFISEASAKQISHIVFLISMVKSKQPVLLTLFRSQQTLCLFLLSSLVSQVSASPTNPVSECLSTALSIDSMLESGFLSIACMETAEHLWPPVVFLSVLG